MNTYFCIYLIGYIVSFVILFIETNLPLNKDGEKENDGVDCFVFSFAVSFLSWITIVVWLLGVYTNCSPRHMYESWNMRRGKFMNANTAFTKAIEYQGILKGREIKEEMVKVMWSIRQAMEKGECSVDLDYSICEVTRKRLIEMGYTVSQIQYQTGYDYSPTRYKISFDLTQQNNDNRKL